MTFGNLAIPGWRGFLLLGSMQKLVDHQGKAQKREEMLRPVRLRRSNEPLDRKGGEKGLRKNRKNVNQGRIPQAQSRGRLWTEQANMPVEKSPLQLSGCIVRAQCQSDFVQPRFEDG